LIQARAKKISASTIEADVESAVSSSTIVSDIESTVISDVESTISSDISSKISSLAEVAA
jgi:hypothetical protein